jgi:hypothetical protein
MKRRDVLVPAGLMCALVLLVAPPRARAQVPEPGPTGVEPVRGFGGVAVAGRLYVGSYGYDAVPQLPDLDGSTTYLLGATLFPGPPFPNWTIGFDFDVWGLSRTYRTVIEGASENETSLETQAFGLGLRAGLPVTLPVGLYLLAGVTYASHTMQVDMQPAWFLPNIPGNSREEEDGGWGRYWGAAFDARVKSIGVGVEYRSVRTSASFDAPFSMDDLALGGSTLYFGASWYGRRR